MIKSLKISNFRSIKEASIDLAPLTFVYGNNAAGKSSIFYALNIIRNVLTDPNRQVEAFFNLGFATLGGFNHVVFRHDETSAIGFMSAARIDNQSFTYKISLRGSKGILGLEVGRPYSLKLELPVNFPYPNNANVQQDVVIDNVNYKVNWNGITAQVSPEPSNDESNKKAAQLITLLNKMGEVMRSTDVVFVKRGFTKVQYGPVSIAGFPISEEEVAAKLSSDPYLHGILSSYLEELMDRQFRVNNPVGANLFNLWTIEKKTKGTIDLVNDGFGVNQLVFLLAKTLNRNAALVCIEEPEINLNPSVIRRLPKVFFELVQKEKKQIVISTHSEPLVSSVLAAIAAGEFSVDDIAFYLAKREDDMTTFERQEITPDGQISGGIPSFFEGQLEDIEKFFKSVKRDEENNISPNKS